MKAMILGNYTAEWERETNLGLNQRKKDVMLPAIRWWWKSSSPLIKQLGLSPHFPLGYQ